MQIDVDHPSNGLDIRNLATAGANAFEGNICLTSVNAPCPSVGPSLTATPNPITVTGNAMVGLTTLTWNAPDAQVVEIHVGKLDGPLFARVSNHGSAPTGSWVSDGMTFYLQDVTAGRPLTSDNTLAIVVVHLQPARSAYFHRVPFLWTLTASTFPVVGLVVAGFYWRRRHYA